MSGVGIADIEVVLPSDRMTLEEMAKQVGLSAEKLHLEIGVKSKPVLKNGVTALDLGIEAASRLLSRKDIDRNAIGVIIFGSCGIAEKYLYSPASKIQKELGIKDSFSFDISNGCNSGNLALQLASQCLNTFTSKKYALIVIGDSISKIVDYSNPDHTCLFNFADGASAVLLERGTNRNDILSFAAHTNAIFADHMKLDWGKSVLEMNINQMEEKHLSQEYKNQYVGSIQEAITKAGLKTSDISHLVMNQGDHKLITYLEKTLPLDSAKIVRTHENHGHVGGSDIFLGLRERIIEKRIQPGDIIVLASSAIGFSWGATVIRG